MSVIFGIYGFMLGAAFGSFCNMLIYRIRYKKGLGGFSYCDKTGKRLIWKDLIPIFSFIVYKGKCRECGERLPIKYPAIELLNAIGFAVLIAISFTAGLSIFQTILSLIIFEIIFVFILIIFDR